MTFKPVVLLFTTLLFSCTQKTPIKQTNKAHSSPADSTTVGYDTTAYMHDVSYYNRDYTIHVKPLKIISGRHHTINITMIGTGDTIFNKEMSAKMLLDTSLYDRKPLYLDGLKEHDLAGCELLGIISRGGGRSGYTFFIGQLRLQNDPKLAYVHFATNYYSKKGKLWVRSFDSSAVWDNLNKYTHPPTSFNQNQLLNELKSTSDSFLVSMASDFHVKALHKDTSYSKLTARSDWHRHIELKSKQLYNNCYVQESYQRYYLSVYYFNEKSACKKVRRWYLDHFGDGMPLTIETKGLKTIPTYHILNENCIIVANVFCETDTMNMPMSWRDLKTQLRLIYAHLESETIEIGCGSPVTWENYKGV
ncbi:MAG: hypothetical protein ACI9JN_000799 [Bacteroidia bacterium]|jgi:hypothetical protein